MTRFLSSDSSFHVLQPPLSFQPPLPLNPIPNNLMLFSNAMVSEATSLAPIAGGTPFPHVAPSAEERLVLQPSLTLLVFILIPCVVLLFFLNCFLLFHRLPPLPLQKRCRRRGAVRAHKHCAGHDKSAHGRVEPRCPHPENTSMCHGRCASISRGLEATQALGESAQMYRDRLRSREWGHKLDETPGHPYSLRPPRLMSMPCCSSRSHGASQDREMTWNEVEDGGGTRSYSEQEMAHNAAPPNTPAAATGAPGTTTPKVKFCHKTSTQRKPLGGTVPFTPLGSLLFDQASSIPQQNTSNSAISSFHGPGLDSDFGVSAGISLHILSSDSDSCSQSWASGMEWDYYDPCYMRKNRLRRQNRQNHNLPVICSKQYWV